MAKEQTLWYYKQKNPDQIIRSPGQFGKTCFPKKVQKHEGFASNSLLNIVLSCDSLVHMCIFKPVASSAPAFCSLNV